MATIEDKNIIKDMVDNNGMLYPGDLQADSIYEYTHYLNGKTLYAIFYNPEYFDLDTSPYVSEYKCLWNKKNGKM